MTKGQVKMATVATESKVVTEFAVERTVVALDDHADLLAEYARLREVRNAADKRVKAINAALDEIMGDAEAGTVNGEVRITVTEVERETIDIPTLKAAFPNAYEVAVRLTRYKKRNLK